MIIWGSTNRDREVDSGTFYCPTCRTRRSYSRQKVSRYFTLYFIPLFPTATLAEYARCSRCCGEFDLRVTTMSQEQVEALVRPWTCGVCGNHNPSTQPACLGCGAGRVPVS